MYEFRNDSPHYKRRRGSFGLRRWERRALKTFVECPKILTLAMHAELVEVTPLHCWCAKTRKQIDFLVPKQTIISKTTGGGVDYLILKVITTRGTNRWLVVCSANRRGFLLEERAFSQHLGHMIPKVDKTKHHCRQLTRKR